MVVVGVAVLIMRTVLLAVGAVKGTMKEETVAVVMRKIIVVLESARIVAVGVIAWIWLILETVITIMIMIISINITTNSIMMKKQNLKQCLAMIDTKIAKIIATVMVIVIVIV